MTERETPLSVLAAATLHGSRVAKAVEAAGARAKATRTALARVLTGLSPTPSWTRDLGDGRCVWMLGGDARLEADVVAALLAGEPVPDTVALLTHTITPSTFMRDVLDGSDVEYALIGGRGTRKTHTNLDTLLLLARQHHALGGQRPYRAMILGSTHVQLKRTVLRSMQAPWWNNGWEILDDGQMARFVLGGRVWLEADLVGVEDEGQGANRVRRECDVIMADDPAPTLGEMSTGFSETAYLIALSSRNMRLPTPLNRWPALLAMNAGSRTHWTSRRFSTNRQPGCVLYRIAADEVLTSEQQDELRRTVGGRRDLAARLLHGEPADAVAGLPVAVGYSDEHHVARTPLTPFAGETWCGWDFGLTPSCIVAQVVDGVLQIYAGLCADRAGTLDFIENTVQPWCTRNMPCLLSRARPVLYHVVDPAGFAASQEDSSKSPAGTLRRLMGGTVRRGPVRWPERRDPLLKLLTRSVSGVPVLQISPVEDNELLRRALNGMWRYATSVSGELRGAEMPIKDHPWSDLANSLTYLVAEMFPVRERREIDRDAPVVYVRGGLTYEGRR